MENGHAFSSLAHCFVIFISIYLAADHRQLVFCGKLGPPSNITKHLSFPDFRTRHRSSHGMRLLGSAGFAEDAGIIHIPAVKSVDRAPVNLSFQAGKALYDSPIRMLDPDTGTPASFHTTFSFQIDGSPNGNIGSTDSSDGGVRSGGGSSGLAFVVVPDELTVGRPGGWLGMLNDACDDTYKAFAVEFDTFKNVEFGDPNDNHVGINLGSVISNDTVDAAAAGVSLKNASGVRAWITYDGVRKWIDLTIARDGSPVPVKPLYSAPLDLSPYLNEYMFVGFSASTEHSAQIHNILSWNFSAVSNAFLRLPAERTCAMNMFKRPSNDPSSKEPPGAFLIFLAVASAFLVLLIYVLCNRKAKVQSKCIATKLNITGKTRPSPPNKPRRFSMSELSLATRMFSEGEILGYGDRGIFYKGILQNGSLIAIKRFSRHFLQGLSVDKRKIMKEVAVISRLRHPNLVPLKGWCYDKRELVMIYEYMQNGSLDKWLFARGVLPWARRYKVVKDIAQALGFLHGGWEKSLVHKNVKISNVLLDITFRARLGDFGLIATSSSTSDISPGNKGLDGRSARHIPPEISVHVQQASDKMDIYNFGVMVLEIVSGRRSMDNDLCPEEADLVDFAWNLHEKGNVVQVADQRLMTRYNPEQVKCLLDVGLLCTQSEPGARPTITEVIGYINGEMEVPPLPSCRPVASFLYPSAPEICMKTCSPAGLHLLGYKSNK